MHGKGAKVILDADGELFTKALQAGPDIIKPNRFELEQYAGFDYRASEKEVLGVAKQMLDKGVSTVAVSMGKSGAMFLIDGEKYRCAGLNVKAHSTVGAGDAMEMQWLQHLHIHGIRSTQQKRQLQCVWQSQPEPL